MVDSSNAITRDELRQEIERSRDHLIEIIRRMTIDPALTGIVPGKPPKPKIDIWSNITTAEVLLNDTVELLQGLEISGQR